MRLCMRQVEAAPQRVAQLVVQRHAHVAETDAAEPGAVEGRGARGGRGRVSDHVWQLGGEAPDAFYCEEVDDGVGVAGVEGFDGVGDGVDA